MKWPMVLCALTTVAAPVAAQDPGRLVERGVQAYDSLEFDAAAGWLRRALLPPYEDDLSPATRRRAITYLAATERFRGRPDSAMAIFRRLLRSEPSVRLDPLVFPPDVSRLFEQVRLGTKAVVTSIPNNAGVAGRGSTIPFHVRATSNHDLRLEVTGPSGALIRTLYAGPIEDTLVIQWDGRDSTGAYLAAGQWFVRGISLVDTRQVCLFQLPIQVTTPSAAALRVPPPLNEADLLPEQAPRGLGPRGALAALLVGAAALALPPAIGDHERVAPGREIVGGALALSAVFGLVAQRPGSPLPENIEINRERRERRAREIAEAQRRNASRSAQGGIRVAAGTGQSIGCGPP